MSNRLSQEEKELLFKMIDSAIKSQEKEIWDLELPSGNKSFILQERKILKQLYNIKSFLEEVFKIE